MLFLLATVIVTGTAFAQIAPGNYFGARGLFTFMPLEAQIVNEPAENRDTDQDLRAAVGQYWGNAFGRIELKFRGQNANMGYEGTILTDTGTFRIDAANVWFKPLPWAKITIGQFADDKLRGNFIKGGNELCNFVLNSGLADFGNDDVIFHLFHGGDSNWAVKFGGAMLTLTPISNLYAVMVLPAGMGGVIEDATKQTAGGETAKSIYQTVQAGLGYTIDNVGLFRMQYVGKPEDKINLDGVRAMLENGEPYRPNYKNDSTSRVEAAFAYMGVDNMVLDIGLKYAFPKIEEYTYLGKPLTMTYNPGMIVGMGFSILVEYFSFAFFGSGHFLNGYDYNAEASHRNEYAYGMHLNFHLVPSYNLGFGFVGLNIGIDVTGKDVLNGEEIEGTGQTNWGIGGWFRKYMGPDCFILTGLTYTFLGVKGYGERGKNEPMGFFRIPLIVEVNFQ
jgi:hypothetical protein